MDAIRSDGLGKSREVVLDSSSACLAVVGQGKEVCLGICQCQLDAPKLRHAAGLVDVSLGGFDGESAGCDSSLILGQFFPGIRKIG